MAYSSITGADSAPLQPSGKDSSALGPSDNSDTGSDAIGTFEAHADSDAVGTGERGAVTPGFEGREGGDILPDRIVDMAGAEVTSEDDDGSLEDLDAADDGETAEEHDDAKL